MKKVLYIDQQFKEDVKVVDFANKLFRNKEVEMIIFYVKEEVCIQTMFARSSFVEQFFEGIYLDEDNVMGAFIHYDFHQIELNDFLEILQKDREVEIKFFSKEEQYSDFRKAS